MKDAPLIEVATTDGDLSDAAIEAIAKLLADWADQDQSHEMETSDDTRRI